MTLDSLSRKDAMELLSVIYQKEKAIREGEEYIRELEYALRKCAPPVKRKSGFVGFLFFGRAWSICVCVAIFFAVVAYVFVSEIFEVDETTSIIVGAVAAILSIIVVLLLISTIKKKRKKKERKKQLEYAKYISNDVAAAKEAIYDTRDKIAVLREELNGIYSNYHIIGMFTGENAAKGVYEFLYSNSNYTVADAKRDYVEQVRAKAQLAAIRESGNKAAEAASAQLSAANAALDDLRKIEQQRNDSVNVIKDTVWNMHYGS